MKKHLLFILFILTGLNIFAQTYNMPANGYLEIHSDSGTIFDDGGTIGNYSTRVNSTVTIYPSTQNAYLIISGNYDFENEYKSKMTLYRGDTNNLEYLTTLSGNGCIAIRSDTLYSPLTIKFIADTETPLSGFNFNFRICTNVPFNISTSNITDSTARINWSESDTSTNWIVEYGNGLDVFGIGQGTKIYSDTNFVDITNIIKCQGRVYYYIYSTCDTVLYDCSYNWDHHVTTQYNYNDDQTYHYYDLTINYFEPLNSTNAFLNAPYDIQINNICQTSNISWQENDTNTVWVVKVQNTQISYMKDSLITTTTSASFNNLKAGYYNLNICPQNYTNENCDCYNQIFWINCCSPIQNFQTIDINENNASFTWDNDTNAGGWIIRYQLFHRDSNQLIRIEVDTNFLFLDNLLPSRPYALYIHPMNDTVMYCHGAIRFATKMMALDDCLTFTNLGDVNFSPRYGSYSNPNQNFGLIDEGYWDVRSRHTVHYDTSEVDPRTDSLLHTVPPGEEASVRLGNWLPGGEGESFTYAYDVDTNIFDLMYLRYAVVMENPGHTMTNQPRFTLEILNANDTLIDPVCGYADFYASDSLGWNSVPGTVTIWKDWTLVGFDITPYHGQRILVRLTTRDCDEGGHFGYAYYHLKCGSKNLISSTCGYVDSNTFIAPIGFNYRWYSSTNPSLTLSTERRLDALVDSTVNYHCLVSSTENPSCTFLYTAYGGYRYPLSQLDYSYTWQPCSFTIDFTNLSTISADGITPAGTGERCESTKWIFPDGDTISTLNAVKTFSDTTEIKVRLISGIANDQCVDIFDTIIKLERPYPNLNIFGDSVVCKNDTAFLFANHGGKYFWSNQDTTTSISFVPLVDTIYLLELIDSLGCYNVDSINIIVNPRDTTYISAEICDNDTYINNGFNTNVAGIHELKLFSQFNCDSIVYLDLTLNPTYNDTIYAEICNGSVYDSNGFNDSITGFYTLQLQTIKGCDSIVNLDLTVNPTYNDTIFADICKGEVYSNYGFDERETGFYTQNLQTIMGCDSIVNLNLIVGEKYNDTIFAEICKGETYNQFGFNEIEQGFYTHSFLSQYGCDSIVNLSLLVYEPYYDTIYDTICKGDIYEEGFNADSSGTYIQNLNTQFGCDSILVLHLQVNPTFTDTIKGNIYKGNVYNKFGFNEKETGVYEQKLQTYLGCDSIIYLDLQVDYIMFPNVVTPNGDGVNDIFDIHNLVEQNAFPENELIIFSRQGKQIYSVKNIKSKGDFWDPQKANSSDGTYFYRFFGKRHDKVLEFYGSIEVMR